MDNLIESFKTIQLSKQCVICQLNYDNNSNYSNSDIICINCSNNYNNFMLEDNEDYIEII